MTESRPAGPTPGAPANAPAAEAPPSDTRREENADELLDLLRRERADFQNFKRRVSQERAADRETAQGDVIVRLLPLLDELDRAFAQRPPELATNPWAEGVLMLQRQLEAALREMGVERIGVVGEEFDPERHEAVMFEPRPDMSTWLVNEVQRPGYRLRGRQLRPARVSVIGPDDRRGGQESVHNNAAQPSNRHDSRRGSHSRG